MILYELLTGTTPLEKQRFKEAAWHEMLRLIKEEEPQRPSVRRVAVKPTSSLPRPQPTVTREGEPTEIITRGRHDLCLLPRFVPMGESMKTLVLVDHRLRWRA